MDGPLSFRLLFFLLFERYVPLFPDVQTKEDVREEQRVVLTAMPQSRFSRALWRIVRFMVVGGLNTGIDLLLLNGLLRIFPTQQTVPLLLFNSVAYTVGAINSFLLNKYWTFAHRQRTTLNELFRFAVTNLFGLTWNVSFLWLASIVPHPSITNTVLWTNSTKIAAIGSAAIISFVGMRLWVFVKTPYAYEYAPTQRTISTTLKNTPVLP